MDQKERYSHLIRTESKRLGFLDCGFSKAEFLEEDAPRLEEWLNKGMHGQMGYMANHFDKRLDPTKLVPDAKSVVSLLYNYYTDTPLPLNRPKIAKYALGKDYHYVVRSL